MVRAVVLAVAAVAAVAETEVGATAARARMPALFGRVAMAGPQAEILALAGPFSATLTRGRGRRDAPGPAVSAIREPAS